MIQISDVRSNVYAAVDGSGAVKVGYSSNIPLRMYHLSRQRGRPVEVFYVEPDLEKANITELLAHWILVDHHDHSEWFLVSPERAKEAIIEARDRVASGERPTSRPFQIRRQDFGPNLEAAILQSKRPAESRKEFIRMAIENEIKRRQRAK
ncbi:GIY-YIG nuclease family protein [Phenylobacterium sp.]|uniref:GIY-YIG nuclease family protein n=1 Tax=Phenylobacterium sp. TaxID=1871053 RepID=UPI00262A5EB2|nr:GIY-YIG nuclease family protein [Phenylobacterium sp.]